MLAFNPETGEVVGDGEGSRTSGCWWIIWLGAQTSHDDTILVFTALIITIGAPSQHRSGTARLNDRSV